MDIQILLYELAIVHATVIKRDILPKSFGNQRLILLIENITYATTYFSGKCHNNFPKRQLE